MAVLGLACSADSTGDTRENQGRSGTNSLGGSGGSGGGAATLGGSGSGKLGSDNPDGPPMELGPPPADMPCASVRVNASRVFPTVMLLVDGSQSMQEPYGTAAVDPDAGMGGAGMAAPPAAISRWQAMRDALVNPMTGVVPALEGLVNFGLAVYGTMPTCPLPLGIINPVRNNFAAISAGLPFQPPGMFTPSGIALDMIANLLPDPNSASPDGEIIGPQIIVFATDGEPNDCPGMDIFAGVPMTNYAPSIAAAQKAAAKNLKMYVIGVGPDTSGTHFQELANVGAGMDQLAGTAQVFRPEDPQALSDTLAMLIGAELSCDLKLEGKGVKMGSECTGTVLLNGNPLECNGTDGWVLTDSTTITLQGTTCDSFKNSVDTIIEAEFPCEAIIVE